MKRDLSVLTGEDIEMIKRWVRGSPLKCPHIGCEKCKALFPNLPVRKGAPPKGRWWRCPCNAFKIKYVTKVANEILEIHDHYTIRYGAAAKEAVNERRT